MATQLVPEKPAEDVVRAWDDDEDEDRENVPEIIEEKKEQNSLLVAYELAFLLTQDDRSVNQANNPPLVTESEKETIKSQLLDQIKRDSMSAYYAHLISTLHWSRDDSLMAELEARNAKELAELEAAQETAKQTAGDIEVRDAMLKKADFFARIGDKERALKEYETTYEATVGASSRIDVVLAILRLALAFNDVELLTSQIARARALVEAGGDWERKNLLGVYEGLSLIIRRKFKEASRFLIDSIPTFTAYELFPYHRLVLYSCTLAMISVDRVTFHKQVLTSPEILGAIDQVPHLRELVFSLYRCHYKDFFIALTQFAPQLQRDPYLSPHMAYYLRELRIVAYNQFLESYRTATIASMSKQFGVDEAFLDRELFRFISSGRVNAKIDAVNGVVETSRPDEKEAQFNQIINQGDALLNRIQNLTRIINS